MVSRLAIGLLNRLEDEESVPARSAAQALGSLAPIFRLLYGWSNEPEIQSMKLARKGGDDVPTAAVNLCLINTTPAQLAEMAKAQVNLDDHFVDHLDVHATECNGQGVGPSAIAPEQLNTLQPVCQFPEKEAPPLPVKQPGKSEPTASLRPVQTKQDSQSDPLPAGHPASSTSVSESEARQKAFEQLRAEHRRASWEKYRDSK